MTPILLTLLSLAATRPVSAADLALESVVLADQARVRVEVANRGPGRVVDPGCNIQFTVTRSDSTTLNDFRDFPIAALAAGETATFDVDFSELLRDQPPVLGRRVAVRVWARNDRNPANNALFAEDGMTIARQSRGLFCRQTGLDPFEQAITLRYGLPVEGLARIEILDETGQRLAVVVNERLAAGIHEVTWNGRSGAREPVATGVYLCRLLLTHDRSTDTTTEKIVFVR